MAKNRQEEIREKVNERNINKEIENILRELPKNERQRLEQIEEKEKRLDLQDTLKGLWKL